MDFLFEHGLIYGLGLFVVGILLLMVGRKGNNRSVRAHTINGPVVMGDMNVGTTVNHQAPSRGWVEWSGWTMTLGGLVAGLVSLYVTFFPVKS